MLEILLFLRKIIRPICKLWAVLWFIGVLTTGSDGNHPTDFTLYLLMFVANVLVLIFYDRLLWHIANKQGVEIYLRK